MYHYAVSATPSLFFDPRWRESFERSGFRRIEFDVASCYTWTEEERTKYLDPVRAMMEDGVLELASLHLPWPWPYSSCDEAVRTEAVKELRCFMEFHRGLHVKNYTFHGSLEPIAPEARAGTIEAVRRTLSEILPFLREEGASVNVELLPRTCIGRVPEELEAIVEGFPAENVGICLDVNHVNGHPEYLPAYIERLSPRIRTFHLSDYDGVDECHWIPGHGVIPWPDVMEKIRAIPHETFLIFECFGALSAPAHQKRRVSPEIMLRNLAGAVCFLEHAGEKTTCGEPVRIP